MAELEPAGLGTRAKIAELNFKSGQEKEAREEFKQIADEIRGEGRQEDLVHFLERVVSIIPESNAEVQELAKIYVRQNEPEKALSKIKVLIEGGRRGEEVLSTLAEAYRLQGKMDRVKSVYKEMLRLFKDEGNQQKLKETAEAILKLDPKDFEAQEAVGKKAAPPAPAPRPAPPPQPKIAPVTPAAPSAARKAPASSEAGAASRYLTEADIFLKYGLKDKAVDSLQQVLKRDPGNELIRKKLIEILGEAPPADQPAAKVAVIPPAPAAPAPEKPPEKVEPGIQPTIDFRLPSEEEVPSPPAAPAPAAPPASKPGSGDGIDIEFPSEGFIAGPEVELPAEAPALKPAAAIEEEVEFDSEEKPEAPAPTTPEISLSLPDLTTPTLDIGDKIGEIAVPAEPEEEAGGAAEVDEELDEAEFYLQQGLQDEAAKIYRRILKIKPDEKRALDRLRQIESGGPISAPAEPAQPSDLSDRSDSSDLAEEPAAAPVSPEKVLETQGDSFFTAEPAESQEEGFDLAHELEEELEAEVPEPAAAEEGPSFDDIFSEFKKGVEREISLDDTQAHYDLGIAYKEMGLLDDAIQELMVAKSDPDKEADCYNLIGILYSQKGMLEKAIEFYIKGLKSPSISKAGAIELSYELGVAYQALGKAPEATRVFERIARNDSEFRDVRERLAELKGEAPAAAAEEEAAPVEEVAEAAPDDAAADREKAEAEASGKAKEKVRQKKISFV
jgi:tetratricopeptide (TPR) repeat protein